MNEIISWLESHDKLSGWAQFFGAMLALLLTYFTAFMPIWRRKKQLRQSALRLLANGYEVLESYHRTSEKFLPFPMSIRVATLTMTRVAEEIDRFPIYELDDHGSRSIARYLVVTALMLKTVHLFLENIAEDLEERKATTEDQINIRTFVGERMDVMRAMLTGAELKRPEWPGQS